jgi:hypothetical protein
MGNRCSYDRRFILRRNVPGIDFMGTLTKDPLAKTPENGRRKATTRSRPNRGFNARQSIHRALLWDGQPQAKAADDPRQRSWEWQSCLNVDFNLLSERPNRFLG